MIGAESNRAQGRVAVYCRIAPASNPDCLLRTEPSSNLLTVCKTAGGSSTAFSFDGVLGPEMCQSSVYSTVCGDFDQVWRGGGSFTVFAYGQSGTGKSWSLLGPRLACILDAGPGPEVSPPASVPLHIADDEDGLLPRLLRATLPASCDLGAAEVSPTCESVMELACIQLYCEQLSDLLLLVSPSGTATHPGPAADVACSLTRDESPLVVREHPLHGVYVQGLSWHPAPDVATAMWLLKRASLGRAVASTRLNATSSRSHLVCMLRRRPVLEGSSALPYFCQTLTVVDLAGSERYKKAFAIPQTFSLGADGSGAPGQAPHPIATPITATLEESRAINLSLTALGNVIAALARRSKFAEGSVAEQRVHIPYRNSSLTRLLQASLSGECRTALLVTVSQLAHNAAETLATCEFGARAAAIRLKAVPSGVPVGPAVSAVAGCSCCCRGDDLCRHAAFVVEGLRAEIRQLRNALDVSSVAGAHFDVSAPGSSASSSGLTAIHAAGDASPAVVDGGVALAVAARAVSPDTPLAVAKTTSEVRLPPAAGDLETAPRTPPDRAAESAALIGALMRQVAELRVAAAAATERAAEAELERESAREELLEVLGLYRESRELLRSAHMEHIATMADAVAELEDGRLREEEARKQLRRTEQALAAASASAQTATDRAAALSARLEAVPAVAELSAAYESTISVLLARVEALEGLAATTTRDSGPSLLATTAGAGAMPLRPAGSASSAIRAMHAAPPSTVAGASSSTSAIAQRTGALLASEAAFSASSTDSSLGRCLSGAIPARLGPVMSGRGRMDTSIASRDGIGVRFVASGPAASGLRMKPFVASNGFRAAPA